MTAPAPVLLLDQVRFAWRQGGFGLHIPRLSLAPAETTLLIGESGSGKSTLLSLACGLVTASEGHVTLCGHALEALSPTRRDRLRAEHLGVIFQQFNLLPYATARDNILLPLRFAPARRARVPDPNAEAARLCAALGLQPAHLTCPAGQLSVGQQQRVAAARALIGAPPLIVADEPTSALDASAQDRFLALLFEQAQACGSAVLMVSHDPRIAPRFDRVLPLAELCTPLVPA